MDAETRARIFDPFFTTKFSGRGLGLAASLGIVRAHSGGLCVRSTQGEGSTFTLYLPAAEHAPQRAGVAAIEEPLANSKASRVLVVDDEPQVRESTALMLELQGHRVTRASSGQEALDLCEDGPSFELVLLDLTMPGLDGSETLSKLRARHPQMPVIVMSGYAESDLRRRVSGSEGIAFLQKPFRAERLSQLVRTLSSGEG